MKARAQPRLPAADRMHLGELRTSRRRAHALLWWGACAVAAAPGWAGAAEPEPPAPAASDARYWLGRMHDATNHRNFQGTFVVTAGGSVASSRIVHYCDGRNQFERIESLDGERRQVFRHNDLVHSYWPHSHVAVVETRRAMSQFPALLTSDADRIVTLYDVKMAGQARVAGHEANVLLLRPRDGYRFGYRLWSERVSGLLLRAEVFDDRERVLEASAFSDLMIGIKAQPGLVVQAMKHLEGYQVQRPVMTPVDLDREGWRFKELPAGFQQVNSVRRSMSALSEAPLRTTALHAEEAASDVMQTIYSDGLTYVSVFIEPFNPALHHREAVMALGATQTLLQRQGAWWITVVGDVPVVTLRAFAAGLEHRP